MLSAFKHFWSVIVVVIALLWGGDALCAPSLTPERIVSLAPDATEILYAIGLGNRIVGVSSACDHPAAVRAKPKVGNMPNPSLEAILALKPDVVVVSVKGNPKSIADRLIKLGKKVYIFDATRLTELPASIRRMGQALGAKEAAEKAAQKIDAAIAKASVRRKKLRRGEIKALFVVWPKPLIVAGDNTIINDAMNINGLKNIAAGTGIAYPHFSIEAVIERRPDLIIIGAAHDPDMKQESKELIEHLRMLDAVRKGQVCYVGDALYRAGLRIGEGLAELQQCGAMVK
ncbi:MAG: helical backbone metal receptor [Desulfuromonadales bacterium]|nr:helical backbone metal receptor [Desulfuromonadales bacterium]